MKKIIVQTKHKFTQLGVWGVVLFVASPIAAGFAYNWLLQESEKRYSANPEIAYLALVLAGIAFSVSIPMMLIGRASLHLAETIEGSDKADEIWQEWSKTNR